MAAFLPTIQRLVRLLPETCLACLLLTPALLRAEEVPMRLGFSSSMFAGINEADAKASVKVLVTTLSRERNVTVDENPPVFGTTESIFGALSGDLVDSVAMTVDELWVLQHDHPSMGEKLLSTQRDPGEEYLVLVHKDRGFHALSDLKGARLEMHFSSRMRVGYFWLESMLARQGLPESESFFSECSRNTKLSKVVLDVFFKKVDCCLVSRRSLAAVIEMNPQVGRQLVPLLSSERLATRMFVYRRPVARRFEDFLTLLFDNLNASVAGRQAMTIFQVDQIMEVPPDELRRSLDLMDELARNLPEVSARMSSEVRSGRWQSASGSIGR